MMTRLEAIGGYNVAGPGIWELMLGPLITFPVFSPDHWVEVSTEVRIPVTRSVEEALMWPIREELRQ